MGLKLGRSSKQKADSVSKRKKKKGKAAFRLPTSEDVEKTLEEEEAGSLWKPAEGKNRILILPTHEDMNLPNNYPWVEDVSHALLGNDMMEALGLEDRPEDVPFFVGCTKHYKKCSCGYCIREKALKQSKVPSDRKIGSALWARRVIYVNMVDLRKPRVVRQYKATWQIRNTLLRAIDAGHHFYVPNKLLEIIVTKKVTGKNARDVRYTADVSRRVHKFRGSWYEQLEDLSTYLPTLQTPDEVQDTLDILFAEEIAGSEGSAYNEYEDDDDDDERIPF